MGVDFSCDTRYCKVTQIYHFNDFDVEISDVEAHVIKSTGQVIMSEAEVSRIERILSDKVSPKTPIDETIARLKALMDIAYEQYASCVNAIIRDELTDIVQIEKVMDGLCDFGDDERFLELYKKLCRHIYRRYPQLVSEHICWVWRQVQAEVEAEDDINQPEEGSQRGVN